MRRGRNGRRGTPRRTVSNGIGYTARDIWSGSKDTPNQEQQLTGFYIGQVMDDRDPQKRGRVWVYIPEVSPRRFDENSLPVYGGTPPDLVDDDGEYDQKLRNGWLLISPLSPFAGSDGFRNQDSPDGRNSLNGDINSYGMWHQPRIGDFIGIMFDRGDSNSGYWIGMAQNPAVGGMVPGVPGTPASEISDRENNEMVDQVQPSAPLPTVDRAPTDENPDENDQIVATDLTRNIVRSGVSADPIRGAGTSGSRRESPSYVTGIKSQGWSYDSEKYNKNGDSGETFEDNIDKYYNHNTVGHQFVMDDHPDHQSVRLRTSNGSQILLNDSGEDPFIYIQTPTGGAWLEISDSGNISIYAQSGLHIHSEGDFNLTVDGDMNVGVKGSIDMRAGGDYSLGVEGLSQQSFSGDMLTEVKGEYDQIIGEASRFVYNGDMDTRIAGALKTSVLGTSEFDYRGNQRTRVYADYGLEVHDEFTVIGGNTINISSGNRLIMLGTASIELQSEGTLSLKTAETIGVESGGIISVKAGGNINMDGGSDINLNSGLSTTVENSPYGVIFGTYGLVDIAAAPVLPPMNKTSQPPTEGQITSNETPVLQDSVASVVPQHQPWNGRAGVGSTVGTTGNVGSTPAIGAPAYNTGNTSCDQSSTTPNFRTGSGFLSSIMPDFLLGGFDMAKGFLSVFGGGANYSGTAQGEAPVYKSLITSGVGETFLANSLDPSPNIIRYIKRQNTLVRTPKLSADRNTYIIGYGSVLAVGDTIGGKVITAEDMKEIRSFSNDFEKSYAITQEEADSRLQKELDAIGEWADKTFGETEFTQQQYDGMISFVHSVGLKNIQNTSDGQKYANALASGDMGTAQTTMYDYVYVGGAVDCSLVDRRRYEVSRFGQPPERGGITNENRTYTPSGNTVNVANFEIEEGVRNAIARAQENLSNDIPDGYLFALASIESGFNTFAQNSQSSAGGLYQFLSDTGANYGIDRQRAPNSSVAKTSGFEVYDPEISAQAGAMFTNDNFNLLVDAGVSGINGADLYAMHFFGSGRGPKFLLAVRNTPNQIAATTQGFGGAARVNRGVFYFRGGKAKTFSEVYQYFVDKVEKPRQYFTGQFDSSIPEATGTDTSGLIKWVPGSRKPDFSAPAAYQGNQNAVRSIAEKSASEAGLTTLAFNSGYRSPDLNKSVGGAQKSQHLEGRAIDIHIGGMTNSQRRAFVERLAINGITGIGVGTNTIHIDTRTTGKATWTYRGGNAWCVDILRQYGWRV